MERLDAAVEHFGETSQIGDVFHGQAGFAESAGGAASGDEANPVTGEGSGEFGETGFVGDA
jgi:hypothetical protein